MIDAGVDLHDVQIAARHAGPRTTLRQDRARTNLDHHPNYLLATYVAKPAQLDTSVLPTYGMSDGRMVGGVFLNCADPELIGR